MTVQTIIIAAETVLVVALVVNLVVRQVKGQYMTRRRLWWTPIVLAAIGIAYLPFTVSTVVRADVLLVGVELVVSVAVGLGLGALTTTRVAAVPDRRGRRIQIISGWKGGALWLGFIAVRLALQPVASGRQAHLAVSAGVVLILLAVARAAMSAVVAPRLDATTASLALLDKTEMRTR